MLHVKRKSAHNFEFPKEGDRKMETDVTSRKAIMLAVATMSEMLQMLEFRVDMVSYSDAHKKRWQELTKRLACIVVTVEKAIPPK